MSIADISLWSALLAGALSFLSPCVLPLVPPYLCYMAGISVDQFRGNEAVAVRRDTRGAVLLAAFFFTLGFATVFIALGAGASTIGMVLRRHLDILAQIGGVIIILMGLHFLGVLRIGLFAREARFQGGGKPATASGAYLMGLAFAFGWTPCIGPALQVVLTLALNEATAVRGAVLALSYALGLGLPFLIAAVALDRFGATTAFVRRHHRALQIGGGLLMIIVGVLLLTGWWDVLMGHLRQWAASFGTVI